MNDKDERSCQLALHRAPGVGAVLFQRLISTAGSAQAVFNASASDWQSCGVNQRTCNYLKNPDWNRVDLDLAWLENPDNHLVGLTDAHYPALLKEIHDSPPMLFVHGDSALLLRPQLAIVGSRNPSQEGVRLATDFASFLSNFGLTITSGMATGIDAAAHRGTLQSGGTTIAVTGTGLDRVYPACHRQLAHQIAEKGALVSEFPPNTPPLAANFPRRNRIISGLSLGTLVVEAALKSGSLITARTAMEQGREVFAIPGSIHNPLARGCHSLIRDGVKLVESGAHILEELGSLADFSLSQSNPEASTSTPESKCEDASDLATEYEQLLEKIGFDPTSIDELVNRSGLTPEEVCSMLLVLELEDRVISSAGGRYARAR